MYRFSYTYYWYIQIFVLHPSDFTYNKRRNINHLHCIVFYILDTWVSLIQNCINCDCCHNNVRTMFITLAGSLNLYCVAVDATATWLVSASDPIPGGQLREVNSFRFCRIVARTNTRAQSSTNTHTHNQAPTHTHVQNLCALQMITLRSQRGRDYICCFIDIYVCFCMLYDLNEQSIKTSHGVTHMCTLRLCVCHRLIYGCTHTYPRTH